MTGLGVSAVQRRIEKQLGIKRDRYLHKPTGKRYAVGLIAAGLVELEGIDNKSIYITSEKLADAEIWEKQT